MTSALHIRSYFLCRPASSPTQFLLFFLRGCGHSLEKTKKGLDFYFSVKSSLPNWFSGWDPTQVPGTVIHLNTS